MDWFYSLLIDNSVAHTILLYSLIIAVGSILGKIKIKGLSLGVTFVLFVGLLMGHFGIAYDPVVVAFLKDFGLILFIFTVGLQVGPGFFSSFKKGGLLLNGLAMLIVILGIGTTIGLYYCFQKQISLPMMVGIMSGAVTNTPGLGAAEEALSQLYNSNIINEIPPISLGYAVTYPGAVLGTILVMMLLKLMFRVNPQKETDELNARLQTAETPDILTFRITNPAVNGLNLAELKQTFGHQFIATRLFNGTEVIIPHADTVLHLNDIVLIVTRDGNKKALQTMLGELTTYEWQDDKQNLVSRRIVVTKNNINGKTIGQLHLRSDFNVNITRIQRAGVNLLARPDLVLQVGDRVMVVGPLASIQKAEKMLGNTLQRLNEPHIITIFLGIFLGIILGSLPIHFPNLPMPAKLGLAGGPLLVAILIGRFGYKLKLITYTTTSANLMLREIGLCLFLTSVGLSSGGQFVETVISPSGLLYMACGLIITMLPSLIVAVAARLISSRKGKSSPINYFTLCGLIAGANTNIPPLVYANAMTESDEASVCYSTVYPLVAFLRILAAQFLILLYA